MTAPSPACRAATTSAAVFDLSHRSHLRLTGSDRAKFLHNFCTNDIKRLQPGMGCEAFICNAKGRVLGHVTVFAEAEDLWLETIPGAATGLLAHLDRYLIREDVTLQDASGEFSEIAFVGPEAVAFLASALNIYEMVAQVPDVLQRGAIPGTVHLTAFSERGIPVRVVDWLGQPAYIPFGPRALIDTMLRESIQAGAVPGTAEDWEALRIAAGWPTYGVDITDDHLPQEVARNARAISFTKGCYLGQEPIARLDALGHTNRELRRLRLDTEQPPPGGSPLCDQVSGDAVGTMTSAASAPDGNGCVALGYLKTRWTTEGTNVDVVVGETRVTAAVR